MIPKECKRLAEVDFPIAVVSKHAAREKSIHYGHPSTLHLWWARRPLAACRAMLLGLLLPDPGDEHCPENFKERARELLPKVQGQVGAKEEDLRRSLLKFIGDFANWHLSSDRTYLEVSRGLVKAAHPEETPLVVDPFAGGGSIPLEALRLGCEAFASDLNPVACLILKVMLEDIPRHGQELADELRRVGAEIKNQAEKELADLYPKDPDGATPIAYLWARTVRCEEPDCGGNIPLLRTGWLVARKTKSGTYKKLLSLDLSGDRRSKKLFSTLTVYSVPLRTLPDAGRGTIKNGKATCLCCGHTMSAARVKAQLVQQSGGTDIGSRYGLSDSDGATLLAVILRAPEGIKYRLPNEKDFIALEAARNREAAIRSSLHDPFPVEPISPIRPSPNARGVSGATRIGITNFGRLFTARQKVALRTLLTIASRTAIDEALASALGLAITKLCERSSSFVTWINSTEAPRGTFARQALTIAWDFIELVPVADDEEYLELIEAMAAVIELFGKSIAFSANVEQTSATRLPLPDESSTIVFTDPPYYDAIPYADLSDFFLVWLKRGGFVKASATLDGATGLSPKSEECTWNQAHLVSGVPKTRATFEVKISEAFAEMRRVLAPNGIASVVFAHKTTEGWEALLTGMIKAGFSLSTSWPIATERSARLNAKEAAALATSVHLVCRPRTTDQIGDWGEVLGELPTRVGDWMERLQSEHIRGADLVFACIGPALEIYSKYSKVVDAEDREIPLGGDPEATEPCKRGYLAYVWEAVGRAALEQVLGTAEAGARNGAALSAVPGTAQAGGALEEDARLTALFLWTLQSTNGESSPSPSSSPVKGEEMRKEKDEDTDDEEENAPKKKKKGLTLVFDVVRRFAQPLGIHLDNWEERIIETEKGIVRLLPVAERGEQLFGQDGTDLVAERLEREPAGALQLTLFAERTKAPKVKGKKAKGKKGTDKEIRTNQEATTLDRVHAAMLLQASGRTNALRALLQAEQERGPDFLRLANALSALYPRESEEKRLLDAMLLAVPK
jgi:putative DNA methylase